MSPHQSAPSAPTPPTAAPPPTRLARRACGGWARSLLAALLVAAFLAVPSPAHAAEVGYPGPGYSGTKDPTAEKPQSKLWFNDGTWWASMFTPSVKAFTVHRLDWATQTWHDTGVVIDDRSQAKMDVLWDGSKLFVASAGPSATTAADSARLYRFSYDAATQRYVRDAGYPSTVVDGGMEAIVMDRDTTGTVWITYTRDNTVFVTHSSGAATTWTTPYPLPVPGAANLTADDISALLAFDGQVGVMWGNQNEDAYYFAVHADGAPDQSWTREVAYTRPEGSDDHINIKSLQNDPEGRVFAIVKTSLNASTDPLNVVLVRTLGGRWDTDNVFGRVQDAESRAILVLDSQNNDVYAFAAAPEYTGGSVYMKKVSVSGLLNGNPFSQGLGQTFIEGAGTPKINNPTSTKQSVNDDSDLVVLASDWYSRTYVHNKVDIGPPGTAEPQTTIDAGPTGTVPSSSATFAFSSDQSAATFQCRLDGGSWTACTSPRTLTSLASGSHTFEVRASAGGRTDTTPATRTWSIDPTAPLQVLPEADATVREATPSTNEGAGTELRVDSSPREQSYLRFSVSGVPSGQGVLSAVLRMRATNGSVNGPEVYPSAGGWSEGGVTWGTRPSTTGPLVADAGAVTVGDWVDYDVSSLVTGNGSYSVALLPDSSDATVFSSRQGADPPRLLLRTGTTAATPPETSITSGPTGTVGSSSATFAFTADSAGATFACRLDGAAWTACTSPTTLTGLASGAHTFAVRATDAAGTDPTPATRSWTVDPTQPSTFRFAATGDARIEMDRPTVTSGSATSLVADTSPMTRSLLAFDVRGLNGTVQSATLRLYVTNGTVNGPTVQPVTSPWAESSVTWATQPSISSTVLADPAAVPADSWLDLDVTRAVSGDGVVDLALVPQSTDGLFVASREAAANPPQLVVTTTP